MNEKIIKGSDVKIPFGCLTYIDVEGMVRIYYGLVRVYATYNDYSHYY